MDRESLAAFPEFLKAESFDVLAPFAEHIRDKEEIINNAPDEETARDLIHDAIVELDAAWPYKGEIVEALGEVLVTHATQLDDDFSEGDEAADSPLTFGRVQTGDPGFRGISHGFSYTAKAVFDGDEYMGDSWIVTHITELEPLILENTNAHMLPLIRYVHSSPLLSPIVALERPPFDELEYTRPKFMADIDQALYNHDTLGERVAALGALVIPRNDVEKDKELDYCRYINWILKFDTQLPYALSGCRYITQATEEGNMQIAPPPSAKFFANIQGVTAIPRIKKLGTGNITARPTYQFALQAKILGEDGSTMTCALPLSEPLEITDLRELHQ